MCDNKAHLAVKSIIERPFSAVKERKLSKDFRVRFARVLLHEFFVEFSEGAPSLPPLKSVRRPWAIVCHG